MTAPKAVKRKSEEADIEGESCTKNPRSTRQRTKEGNKLGGDEGVDPWSRLAATGGSSSASGRGSLAGWTSCPLCGEYSKKKHALGRGIANHLKDVHTPWNPGKLAQKIHRRQYERRKREKQQYRKRKHPSEGDDYNTCGTEDQIDCSPIAETFKPLISWTPTDDEKKAWAQQMLAILRKIEEENTTLPSALESKIAKRAPNSISGEKSGMTKTQNQDKAGQQAIAYRDSLPPFLMAASKGDLTKLQELVNEANKKDTKQSAIGMNPNETKENDHHHLLILLNTRDRHKSTADHWAAGSGHLDCLRYLYNLRAKLGASDSNGKCEQNSTKQQDLGSSNTGKRNTKARRRDGKTCLHYAARNGHVSCIRYLLEPESLGQPENINSLTPHTVDERSGEGTTPLHLACYGGHPRAVKHLVEEFGADPHAKNDWGCTCAHWVAMTLSSTEGDVKEICNYLLQTCGISFVETQGQGHTALHKAAHRLNAHVIRWMAASGSDGGAGLDTVAKEKAGRPDQGGHRPSDIWRNMGGDAAFAEWMNSDMGW